jgi:hypothetical protein
MPENTVSVARPSIWGNPFIVGKSIGCDDQADAVEMHENWLAYGDTAPYPLPGETKRLEVLREKVLGRIHELRGKNLACFCALDAPCHADILLEAATGDGARTGRPRRSYDDV